jgi:hypothetical protein
MPKATTVYGIISFGGHLVRGVVRVVLTSEEPMLVLENDKMYYGENVKARVTKTKVLTLHELTEKLEEAFASHKTDVPHMYKLNSSESVKILKTVFDVKTCKKLSFSKESDDESESNESLDEPTSKTVETAKEETKNKSSKTDETKGKSSKTVETAKEEPKGKSSKTVETAKEEPKGKSSKTVETAKDKSSKTVETTKEEPKGKSSKTVETAKEEPKSKKVVKEEVSASKKKPDLTDSKKTTTSKVKESKTRIPLSDSDDDNIQSDDDLDL